MMMMRRQKTLPARLRGMNNDNNSSNAASGGGKEASGEEEYTSLRDILSSEDMAEEFAAGSNAYGRAVAWRIWRDAGRGSMNLRRRSGASSGGSIGGGGDSGGEEAADGGSLQRRPPQLLKNRLLHRAALAYCMALQADADADAAATSSAASWAASLSAAFLRHSRSLRRLASHCCLAILHLHRNYIRPFLLSHSPSTLF